jgi:hypothetical protein
VCAGGFYNHGRSDNQSEGAGQLRNIHKYTGISDKKVHSQLAHVLIEKQTAFNGGDSDTDRYMVVAKVRERQSVSK